MKILCVFGRHAYGNPARGESYEFVNFIPALHKLGHEVALFDCFDRTTYQDFAELNRAFLKAVEREQPQLIFCVLMGYELWSETLHLAKQASGACLLNWAADDSWKYEEFSRYRAPSFDIYATTYRSALQKASRDGFENFTLTQWAAPTSLIRDPKPASACRYTVSFVGSAYGNRREWITDLRQRGIEVCCFGHGWESGAVSADQVGAIINDSTISLNFGDSGLVLQGGRMHHSRQIKARIFEVPAAGGCLLTETAEGLEEYFIPGEEIETFSDINALADKIKQLLANPDRRNRIAQAGNQRVRRGHTYEIRLQPLLEKVPPGQSQTQSTDWPAFERLIERHRPGWWLRLLKILLTGPCMLIWGRQRGPRAARRLLFELNWRIAGSHTYSAGGWPGRLFFRES
ncbi:MAG: glycosyltransferase [Sterolibacterium sp.]